MRLNVIKWDWQWPHSWCCSREKHLFCSHSALCHKVVLRGIVVMFWSTWQSWVSNLQWTNIAGFHRNQNVYKNPQVFVLQASLLMIKYLEERRFFSIFSDVCYTHWAHLISFDPTEIKRFLIHSLCFVLSAKTNCGLFLFCFFAVSIHPQTEDEQHFRTKQCLYIASYILLK